MLTRPFELLKSISPGSSTRCGSNRSNLGDLGSENADSALLKGSSTLESLAHAGNICRIGPSIGREA